jgi:hypothetical protein
VNSTVFDPMEGLSPQMKLFCVRLRRRLGGFLNLRVLRIRTIGAAAAARLAGELQSRVEQIIDGS